MRAIKALIIIILIAALAYPFDDAIMYGVNARHAALGIDTVALTDPGSVFYNPGMNVPLDEAGRSMSFGAGYSQLGTGFNIITGSAYFNYHFLDNMGDPIQGVQTLAFEPIPVGRE